MEESTTYRATIARGKAEEARRMLLIVGAARLGPADAATTAAIESMESIDGVEALAKRVVSVESWAELFG